MQYIKNLKATKFIQIETTIIPFIENEELNILLYLFQCAGITKINTYRLTESGTYEFWKQHILSEFSYASCDKMFHMDKLEAITREFCQIPIIRRCITGSVNDQNPFTIMKMQEFILTAMKDMYQPKKTK